MENEIPNTGPLLDTPGVGVTPSPDRQGQVEATGSSSGAPAPQAGVGHDGNSNAFFAQRRVTEKLDKRMEKIEDTLSNLNQFLQTSPASVQPTPPPLAAGPADIFTAPDQFVDQRVQKAMQQVQVETAAKIRASQVQQAQKEAEQYVLSQEYINPKTDYEALQTISKEHGLDELGRTQPYKAAETLLKLFKQDRGITSQNVNNGVRTNTIAVNGTPAMLNGKKVWTRAEIASLAKNLPKYEEHRADILDAAQTGRIQG